MKGVLFTELVDLIEERHGLEVADRILTECDLATGGAFTSVGTYDHRELLRIVDRLGEQVGSTRAAILKDLGKRLAAAYARTYAWFFDRADGLFGLLEDVNDLVHEQVRRLQPEAELPELAVFEAEGGCREVIYRSPRPLADLAQGMLEGCAEHFDTPLEIQRAYEEEGAMNVVRFVLRAA